MPKRDAALRFSVLMELCGMPSDWLMRQFKGLVKELDILAGFDDSEGTDYEYLSSESVLGGDVVRHAVSA